MVTDVSNPSVTVRPARPDGSTSPSVTTDGDRTNGPADRGPAADCVASAMAPLLAALVGTSVPVRFTFWDGSSLGPADGIGTIEVRSADALRRVLWAPGELGVARAFVAGDLVIDGDLYALLRVLHDASPSDFRQMGLRTVATAVDAARRLGVLGPPLPAPAEECKPAGRLHSLSRDAKAISHHYDVGNEFYRLVLGPSMTYSCARFVTEETTLEEAQAAKYELICRKLGIDRRPGSRLLDVGCGWGSMAIHAARHHGARVVGRGSQPRAGGRGQTAGARRRARRPGGDPAAGLPRAPGRAVRRHLLDRDVRARGRLEDGPVLRDPPRTCWRRPDGCSTTPSPSPAGRCSGRRTLHRPLRLPRRRAGRRGRGGRGHAAGRVRGPRRRVAARALLPDPAPLGGQPRGPLGRGGGPGGHRPGPTSGGSTWPRSANGFEDGGTGHPPGAGCAPR